MTSTSLTINKEMFGTFALLSLALMLWTRFRYGPGLWDDLAIKASYTVLGFIATGVAIVNGSLGGEAGLLGTALADTWDFLGVTSGNPMVLPTAGGIAFLAVVVAGLGLGVIAWVVRRRAVS